MNQLLRLMEAAGGWPAAPAVYLTTSPSMLGELCRRGRAYDLGECNRHRPFQFLRVLVNSLVFAVRERPDVVISTGSLPIAIACLCSKLFGARIVWIDSIANVEQLSASGSMMRRFADLFLTQWPHLAERHPGIEYVGEIV